MSAQAVRRPGIFHRKTIELLVSLLESTFCSPFSTLHIREHGMHSSFEGVAV